MASNCKREIYVRYMEEIVPWEGGEALAQLPREAVAAPGSLEVFKARPDRGHTFHTTQDFVQSPFENSL